MHHRWRRLAILALLLNTACPTEPQRRIKHSSPSDTSEIDRDTAPDDAPPPSARAELYAKLDDPSQKDRAVRSLALLRDTSNLDAIVRAYTTGGLSQPTVDRLMIFLADQDDVRAAPAFAKALDEVKAGTLGDAQLNAALGARRLALLGKASQSEVLVASVWGAFANLRYPAKVEVDTRNRAIAILKHLIAAVLAIKHPSYGPKAVEALRAPIQAGGYDTDETARQSTAIQVISALAYTEGVKAIVRAMVTPNKTGIVLDARAALLRMPKEAEAALLAAFNGSDPEVGKLADGPRMTLADALANLSRPAGHEAIVAALKAAKTDDTRAQLAQALMTFPPDPRHKDLVLAAYAAMGKGIERGTLSASIRGLYDPSIVPWLVKEAATDADVDGTTYRLRAAIFLMTSQQKAAVKAGVAAAKTRNPGSNYASPDDELAAATEVVDKCDKDLACYLTVAEEPPAGDLRSMTRLEKALTMSVVYGQGANADATRAKLLALVKAATPSDTNKRSAIVIAIDRLAPKGDPAAADALEQIGGFTDAALRLRARALP